MSDEIAGCLVAGTIPPETEVSTGRNQNGIIYSEEALRRAAMELDREGAPVVVSDGSHGDIIGEITAADYERENGLVYRARITADLEFEKLYTGLIHTAPKFYITDSSHDEQGVVYVNETRVENVGTYTSVIDEVVGVLWYDSIRQDLYEELCDVSMSEYLEDDE